ncbi:4-hydroxy-tetrahydrodipicolinate synthase [Breznakia sp. PF5-3]|nr:4-hydroxy-tetrahydrodipicolinate synthase [Breznakia sp. PM6-1]MDF9834491.1 4-hydroxy-tetrahydrodipicolinate synthase [Breznakia sp. PF5-3]MDF9837538.1 4-hydroxy-tetrahydrodipicolinate synthase [Breznakia sp. PFB2-8]MDF9859115.1 4-hydroxy-tetrahydrodipicolinate synthase [Breznakia sp. PH5-24]
MLVKGSIVALITPFNENGSVNFNKLGELIEFHVKNKTDALLVLGTTGETPTLSHEEDDSVVKYTIEKVDGRLPIYVGAGSNNTTTQLTYCKKYEKMGADALLVIAPYYNKANEEGMYLHFKTVADEVNIPLILYNVPGRTGCSISYSVVKRLATHKNIAAIKEASGDISYLAKISKLASEDFYVYSGNDDMVVPAMSLGGSGVISVSANILPEAMHNMVTYYLEGKTDEALHLQLKYLDLINALFIETNPIPVKEAMNQLGMEVGGYRLPLTYMSDANREILINELKVMED